ncbi:hypothetical protein OESDEN_19475 [Oesophagostomum dentatum]|uniref:Uncharacterized protein n=1 Tax=Oesophagostomum dentatum TaxID=61180 RepID=A0A0B1SC89_OESDE|nr:hypothetical protein OESDEN_19475 [Oesophagostomum dentatum]
MRDVTSRKCLRIQLKMKVTMNSAPTKTNFISIKRFLNF